MKLTTLPLSALKCQPNRIDQAAIDAKLPPEIAKFLTPPAANTKKKGK